MHFMRRAWLIVVLLAGLVGSVSCGAEPDAKQALTVTDLSLIHISEPTRPY